MNQQYQMTDYVTVEEYQTFRKAVGWQLFGDEQAKAGIEHTYHIACIRQNEKAVAMASEINGRIILEQEEYYENNKIV